MHSIKQHIYRCSIKQPIVIKENFGLFWNWKCIVCHFELNFNSGILEFHWYWLTTSWTQELWSKPRPDQSQGAPGGVFEIFGKNLYFFTFSLLLFARRAQFFEWVIQSGKTGPDSLKQWFPTTAPGTTCDLCAFHK